MKSTDWNEFTESETRVYEELLRCKFLRATERSLRDQTGLDSLDFFEAVQGLVGRKIVYESSYRKWCITTRVYNIDLNR